jgi:hypothetical protein
MRRPHPAPGARVEPFGVDDRSLERGRKLLRKAKESKRPLEQRLMVAAAITTVMASPPIVVGGTAEEFWAHDDYHPTDLDLIPRPSPADENAFLELGLKRKGRFWIHPDLPVATEFPHDPSFEVRRTSDKRIAGVTVKLIGVDDLYLDRLQQTTMTESTSDQHFASLLAVAAANWDQLDWKYIERRIRETRERKPALGESMQRMNTACRRVARKQLSQVLLERL